MSSQVLVISDEEIEVCMRAGALSGPNDAGQMVAYWGAGLSMVVDCRADSRFASAFAPELRLKGMAYGRVGS